MTRWAELSVKLRSSEDAATVVEYTLMMIFVALSCAAAVTNFGSALSGLFRRAINGFSQ